MSATNKNYVVKVEAVDGMKFKQAYSRKDGGYIGTPEDAEHLNKMGIVPELARKDNNVCSIGFCEKEQKWYGWSHRAIFGFGIGSEVKKGDCGYVGATPEDMIEDRVAFFSDLGPEKAKITRDECQILPDRSGIRILHAPLMVHMVASMEDAVAAVEGEDVKTEMVDLHKDAVNTELCGHGEWKADTLEEAKQMAIDFADGVS